MREIGVPDGGKWSYNTQCSNQNYPCPEATNHPVREYDFWRSLLRVDG